MISKRYHYVINLGIACNVYISIDPVYPGSCGGRSIVAGEPSGIRRSQRNPSPWIHKSIIHDEF